MVASELSWQDLALLLAALDHGSLNRAALALGVSQSTASRRLQRLEDGLNARIFDRTPEGLLPTALALDLAPHARLIAGHMTDIQRLASGQEAAPSGRVRLAVVDGLAAHFLCPRLKGFYQRFPQVQVDLLAGQAVVDLVRREADLALRFVPPSAPDLVSRPLGQIPMAPYALPHLAADPDRPWVALLDDEERFMETRWLKEHTSPERLTRVSAWSDLFAAVRAGLGAALISPLVAEQAGLVRVEGLPPVAGRDLLLVYHRAMRGVPRVAALRGWLIQIAQDFFA
ncbi:MAG: DNA-binding transcriptional LysR family regulator [Cognaticolwellia sp.]|jgi:DNA-binding transcriptional LysR family regulator